MARDFADYEQWIRVPEGVYRELLDAGAGANVARTVVHTPESATASGTAGPLYTSYLVRAWARELWFVFAYGITTELRDALDACREPERRHAFIALCAATGWTGDGTPKGAQALMAAGVRDLIRLARTP